MKKIIRGLKLLNPKYLSSEVRVYGYTFSWKSNLLVIISSLFGIVAIGILFQLEPAFFMLIAAMVAVMLPAFILNIYHSMFEQRRFADAATYLEQMLYAFQKSGKVVSALKETRDIFETGRMRFRIEDAIEYLERGKAKSDRGILREALDTIESGYACVKVHMVHEMLISSETHGGDMESAIQLMLNDIELWKRRCYLLQAEKKQSHRNNICSIIAATGLCAAALYALDMMGKMFPGQIDFSIFAAPIIQVSSCIFIICMLIILSKSFASLTSNWLQGETLHSDEYIESSYVMVMNYDDDRGRRRSFILAIPLLLGTAVTFMMRKTGIMVVCFLLMIMILIHHRIGYNLAKKDINNELYLALPQWLMEIALLLQNNNVQVSIARSAQEAPAVLREELRLLLVRLQDNPASLQSYTMFCSTFDVPEIQSCMKMLHAISESGSGNAQIQINNLIQRVQEMQNMADDIRNESISFRVKLIFTYPVLVATVKLLCDLTVGMIYMVGMLGNIGGV